MELETERFACLWMLCLSLQGECSNHIPFILGRRQAAMPRRVVSTSIIGDCHTRASPPLMHRVLGATLLAIIQHLALPH